jgi:beta-glucanase (GH16 family)
MRRLMILLNRRRHFGAFGAAFLAAGLIAGTGIVGLIGAAGTGAKADVATTEPDRKDGPPPGYKLVWHDEFNGDKLNTDDWIYRKGARFWSTQLPENVSLSEGMLRIAGKKEKAGSTEYTCGGIISKKSFKYGYYETRMRIPPGKGWHSSFWLMWDQEVAKLPADSDKLWEEIDVFENDSIHPDHFAVTVHQWPKAQHKATRSKIVKTTNLADDFHVIGCEFVPGEVRVFVDGKLMSTVDIKGYPEKPVHIWLTSIAAPLGKTDSVDDRKLPANTDYDWVRVYEKQP